MTSPHLQAKRERAPDGSQWSLHASQKEEQVPLRLDLRQGAFWLALATVALLLLGQPGCVPPPPPAVGLRCEQSADCWGILVCLQGRCQLDKQPNTEQQILPDTATGSEPSLPMDRTTPPEPATDTRPLDPPPLDAGHEASPEMPDAAHDSETREDSSEADVADAGEPTTPPDLQVEQAPEPPADDGRCTVEICNNLDDDCDGKVDNVTRACYTGSKATQNVGACKDGIQKCVAGTWESTCTGEVKPTVETCDSIDNDCDGKVDEICGPAYAYAIVKSDGNAAKQRNLNPTRLNPGIYRLNPTSGQQPCSTTPVFLTPSSGYFHASAYSCMPSNTNLFRIITSKANTTNVAGDAPFHAVVPTPDPGEAWGFVQAGSCPRDKQCDATFNTGGTFKFRNYAKGHYWLFHPLCRDGNQPVFVTLYSTTLIGYVYATYGSDRCLIRTYDVRGVAADFSFAFWFPSKANAVWARIDTAGQIPSKNNFGGQGPTWNVSRQLKPENHFRITSSAWAKPSAVLVSLRNAIHREELIHIDPSINFFRVYLRHFASKDAHLLNFYTLLVQ